MSIAKNTPNADVDCGQKHEKHGIDDSEVPESEAEDKESDEEDQNDIFAQSYRDGSQR